MGGVALPWLEVAIPPLWVFLVIPLLGSGLAVAVAAPIARRLGSRSSRGLIFPGVAGYAAVFGWYFLRDGGGLPGVVILVASAAAVTVLLQALALGWLRAAGRGAAAGRPAGAGLRRVDDPRDLRPRRGED